MNNNLRNIEKNLRAFIKRCKEITYTKGLLFTFLMTGSFSQVNGKAKKDETTGNQRKQIENSIGDMKKLFKDARYENNKLLKSSNLELIQLMEQGDHVVKSPWSSWQYGINGFSVIGEVHIEVEGINLKNTLIMEFMKEVHIALTDILLHIVTVTTFCKSQAI